MKYTSREALFVGQVGLSIAYERRLFWLTTRELSLRRGTAIVRRKGVK